MNRVSFSASLVGLILLAVLPLRDCHAADQPNVLLILADDLGYQDLGFQGSPDIQSPHLDRMAGKSIRFTDAHVTASVCSPSRAGLLTGRYQQRFGHEANSPPHPQGMDRSEATMADRMKSLGYRTAAIGKWHLGATDDQYPTRRGFDTFYGLREGGRGYLYDQVRYDKPGNHRAIERDGKPVKFAGYLTDVLGQQAIDFIDLPSSDPFFVYLSFTAPHGPLQATEEDLQRFQHIADKRRRTYAAMVWAMDRAIGKVMDHLQQIDQLDNTIVWFLSDNGGATNNASSNVPLAGHKGIKFEGGIRVPFLMHWSGRFQAGRTEDRMVSSMDILPTSFAAAGGDPKVMSDGNRPVDGVNLLPFLSGRDDGVPHRKLYWHKLWFSAMRDGPWKLIYVQDYGYALYNVADDVSETSNLAARMPERTEAMVADMNRWKQDMAQPLWSEGTRWFKEHSKNHIRIIEGGR
ncbi:Arylsulfatase precursor [Rubripirellula lacrimiformis]|uniref:Arylsulfatase n=1 Tax=Rubripirellula lacrimiformis TaxID=1930273 RepID=A0A517NB71_9BACT|nr:sulfatase-like hydrolase/transferase [Rubripirellula lacrimiformis]QDT04381.1 Arylsulfatase precursor [Rubripirellula lacrimiformis]